VHMSGLLRVDRAGAGERQARLWHSLRRRSESAGGRYVAGMQPTDGAIAAARVLELAILSNRSPSSSRAFCRRPIRKPQR
jgi:hypothetical protein